MKSRYRKSPAPSLSDTGSDKSPAPSLSDTGIRIIPELLIGIQFFSDPDPAVFLSVDVDPD